MKQNLLFFSDITRYKSDLQQLRTPDRRLVLVASQRIFKEFSQDMRDYFDETILLDEMMYEQAKSAVMNYQQRHAGTIRLLTNDEKCLMIVAKLNELLHTVGPRPALIQRFCDKDLMIQAAVAAGVRVPQQLKFSKLQYAQQQLNYLKSVVDVLEFPLIVKPTNLYGAAGTVKINSIFELSKWANDNHAGDQEYVLAEYIDGTLFHCNAVIQQGKCVYSTIEEYTWPCLNFRSGQPLGSIYLPSSDSRWHRLESFHQKILAALQPPDGATHTEIFMRPDGELVFLEIAARACGAEVVPLHEKATGINLELEHFKARLGEVHPVVDSLRNVYYAWAYIAKKPGKIARLTGGNFDSKVKINWYIREGDKILPHEVHSVNEIAFHGSSHAGLVILENRDFSTLYKDFQRLRQTDFIEVEGEICRKAEGKF